MKNSEKLFLLINEIDEKIIENAKPEEQKPIYVKPEPRSFSIKGIIALAACVAVLAAGVFTFVKFKLGGDIDPIQDESSEQSSDSGSSDYDPYPKPPDIEPPFTKENKELYDIVKPLVENASEIVGTFSAEHNYGGGYWFNFGDSGGGARFFLLSADQRTEPNGLFEIPQTYDGMKELLLTCLTPQAAESYMQYIGKGSLKENSDGTFTVYFDEGYEPENPRFIEIDGKMYRSYMYTGEIMNIDLQSLKFVDKTDDIINFTYSYTDWYGHETTDANGVLAYHNGWKLNYFRGGIFLPVFTEQDIELQAVLEELTPNAELIAYWIRLGAYGDFAKQQLLIPGQEFPVAYAIMPTGKTDSGIKYPQTLKELEALMLEYLTQEVVDDQMANSCKGTMTENPDGTYTVVTDREVIWLPNFIEIDGKLYVLEKEIGFYDDYYWNTAHIIEKTDSNIRFSYVCSTMGSYYLREGLIKYERGGWRIDPFYNPQSELWNILYDIQSEALDLDGIFNSMSAHGDKHIFIYEYNDPYTIKASYYLVSDGLRTEPGGLFAFPQSRAELEELLSKYFSKRAVKSYLKNFSTGSMTKNSDGTFTVQTDCGYLTPLIEIDGRLYYSTYGYTKLNFDIPSAEFNSKIGNTILFDFADPYGYNQTGMLVYEDGVWKLNYYNRSGFIPEYPTEFTEQDEKLQEILEELSPCDSINGWFNSAGEYSSATYKCSFPESDQPDIVMFYSPLPKGKFDYGKAEYPQSLDELEALLMKYFTQQTVNYYMERARKVTITEGSDGTFTATTGKKITTLPKIIEIDGQLYHAVFEKSGNGTPLFETARVTSQTNDSIEFTYLQGIVEGYYDEKGVIEFERGGWRMNYYKAWFN